jgi:hypothetical protein
MRTHTSFALSSVSVEGSGTEGAEMDSFFACPTGTLGVVPGARAGATGRVGLEDDARDARGVARVVGASPFGRVVKGLFAVVVVVVVEGAMDCLDIGFPGDTRGVVPAVMGVRRTAGFLFSSPDVTEERSGSASEVPLDVKPGRLAVPGTGRVGGLLRLPPTALVRDVVLGVVLDAPIEVRALLVVDAAAGRRALAALPPVAVVVGLRGGTASFEPEFGAFEAIFLRTDEVGVDGAGSFLGCVGLAGSVWLAGVGVSIWRSVQGLRRSIAVEMR